MKIHLERGDTIFEYELKPMKESRFRTLCVLAACGLYVGLTWVVASLCGIPGVILLAVVTTVLIVLDKM